MITARVLHEVAGVTWGGEDQSVWKPCWQNCTCEDQFKFFSQSLFFLLSIARWHTFFFCNIDWKLRWSFSCCCAYNMKKKKKNQWRLQILLFVGDLNSGRFLYGHTWTKLLAVSLVMPVVCLSFFFLWRKGEKLRPPHSHIRSCNAQDFFFDWCDWSRIGSCLRFRYTRTSTHRSKKKDAHVRIHIRFKVWPSYVYCKTTIFASDSYITIFPGSERNHWQRRQAEHRCQRVLWWPINLNRHSLTFGFLAPLPVRTMAASSQFTSAKSKKSAGNTVNVCVRSSMPRRSFRLFLHRQRWTSNDPMPEGCCRSSFKKALPLVQRDHHVAPNKAVICFAEFQHHVPPVRGSRPHRRHSVNLGAIQLATSEAGLWTFNLILSNCFWHFSVELFITPQFRVSHAFKILSLQYLSSLFFPLPLCLIS